MLTFVGIELPHVHDMVRLLDIYLVDRLVEALTACMQCSYVCTMGYTFSNMMLYAWPLWLLVQDLLM